MPTSFQYRGDVLCCEDVPVNQLAEEFGTPLYVYSLAQLRRNIATFTGAANRRNNGFSSSYALKANSNPSLLAEVCAAGLGADVVSGGELRTALDAGFTPEKITYAGVGKRDDEIRFALRSHIGAFCVESEEELSVVSALALEENSIARVAIRVNPDVDAGTHPFISTGMHHNKFGIAIDVATRTCRNAASMSGIDLIGLHMHIGSQVASSEPYVDAALAMATLVRELQGTGITIKQINMGGGFAVSYHNVVAHAALPKDENGYMPAPEATTLEAILSTLRETGSRISIEPGRAIVASAGALITRTLFTKTAGPKHFTIVDAAMNDLIRPCLYDAYHQIVPAFIKQEAIVSTDVVGPICETSDFLARDRAMITPTRGDVLAVMCAGAYGMTLASNYNMRGRAAEVLVDGAVARVVREREKMF